MADPALHRNGYPCPACELRREEQDTGVVLRPAVPCNRCGGTGRIARSPLEICEEHSAEARRVYWPEREARWRNE